MPVLTCGGIHPRWVESISAIELTTSRIGSALEILHRTQSKTRDHKDLP